MNQNRFQKHFTKTIKMAQPEAEITWSEETEAFGQLTCYSVTLGGRESTGKIDLQHTAPYLVQGRAIDRAELALFDLTN